MDTTSSIMLWQPLVTKTNGAQIINLSVGYHCGNHKRTRQGVSTELLSYLYKLQVFCAIIN